MRAELCGALVIAAMLAMLIGLAETLARRTAISPEWSRKLVHLGGGLGCLLFPLLLESSLTVLLLAVVSGGGLWLAERRRWLQCLCRVTRRSRGGAYYPLAIAALFRLTAGRYDLYVAAVLVLTVADTAAALVGSHYGRIRYRTGGVDEHKSLEGSLAFWALAFLAVFAPLAAPAGDANLWQSLLSAFLAATLLTAVEAVSIGGRDNLYVPLLAAFLLLKTVTKPVPELAMQAASMVAVFALLPAVNRYGHLLRVKDLVVMCIILYGVWSLGSVDWAVPLLTAFMVFALVFNATGGGQRRTRVYRRMAALTAPAAALVFAANLTGEFAFAYGPFLAAVLVPLVWGVVVQLGDDGSVTGWIWSARQIAAALSAATLVVAEPVLMRRAPDAPSVLLLAGGAILMVWLGIGLLMSRPRLSGGKAVFVAACLAILLTAGGQLAGVAGIWRPALWADVYRREVDAMLPLRCPLDRKGSEACR